MNYKIKEFSTRTLYTCIDFICVIFAIYFACKWRSNTLPFEVTLANVFFKEENPHRFMFNFWVVTTVLSLSRRELYQTRREVLEGFEIGLVLRSVLISTIIVITAIYGVRLEDFPRSILTTGSTLIFAFLTIWRIFKRQFVEYLVTMGYNNFNALIIGAGRVGLALFEEIQKRPGLGIRVVGFLDDYKISVPEYPEFRILGKLNDFKGLVRGEFINEIFLTIHPETKDFLQLLEEAKEARVAIRVVPQGFDLVSGEFSKYNIGIIPILEYSTLAPLHKQVGKRLFDFIFSLMGTIVLLPVLFIIGILIKLDSPGPILYISKRYGRNGQKFSMFKFRSMHIGADKLLDEMKGKNEVDGPIFKVKKDPRITRVGRILRKYSLDELPQILNVLWGHMSLVGPRPLPIDQIEKEDLKQLKRLEIRPGITGLWQIRGRSDLSFNRLVKWDTWYINNWSFWLDLNILFQTIPVVIKAKGAY